MLEWNEGRMKLRFQFGHWPKVYIEFLAKTEGTPLPGGSLSFVVLPFI